MNQVVVVRKKNIMILKLILVVFLVQANVFYIKNTTNFYYFIKENECLCLSVLL